MDKFLYYHLDELGSTEISFINRTLDDNEHVQALPDAVYRVTEANDANLIYDVRVNDHHMWHYHRENGFTKIGIQDKKLNITSSAHRVMEGQIEAASIINKAYIKNNFNNVTVMAGINMYPLHFDIRMVIEIFQNIESCAMLPFALCLSLPVFMYTLVLEKEKKLIETMKINGLQLRNYWMVNYFFNYLYYMLTVLHFLFWAKYLL